MARVSEIGPSGQGANPFGFLGDLMKMLQSDGPLNWQIARQAALAVSTGGEVEANVDPLARLRLEELLRVADLHVSDTTGLATSQTGGIVSVRAVTKAEWAYFTLDHFRSLFEGLAAALTPPPDGLGGPGGGLGFGGFGLGSDTGDDAGVSDAEAGLLGSLPQVLGPFFLGAQAGTLCGHLAGVAMGQYELPIPRPPSDELMMVPSTIASFAEDWTLPPDDVRLWVCISELAHHAVIGRPHVRARLEELLGAFVSGFRIDPTALAGHLEQLDLADPSSLPELFSNPEALLGAVTTPAQHDTEQHLSALVSAIEGYVDHVVDTVGRRLIGSHGQLSEALRRRRVEASGADQLIRELFGLELSPAAYDRGQRFVDGVVDRAGEDGLARLWRGPHELPTPAEVDAPGLWLERIDIPR
jgi:putative hydrolase